MAITMSQFVYIHNLKRALYIGVAVLQAIIGAANPNPGNGFSGAALFVLASTGTDITSMPSLRNLTDINGTTILQDLAVYNLTNGLQVFFTQAITFEPQHNHSSATAAFLVSLAIAMEKT